MGESWLDTLGAKKEDVFAAMRSIRKFADMYARRANDRTAPGGQVGGAAAFDEFLKAEALSEILRGVSRGMTPEAAAEAAKGYAKEMVHKHNARSKDVSWKRWPGGADDKVDWAMRMLTNASK